MFFGLIFAYLIYILVNHLISSTKEKAKIDDESLKKRREKQRETKKSRSLKDLIDYYEGEFEDFKDKYEKPYREKEIIKEKTKDTEIDPRSLENRSEDVFTEISSENKFKRKDRLDELLDSNLSEELKEDLLELNERVERLEKRKNKNKWRQAIIYSEILDKPKSKRRG